MSTPAFLSDSTCVRTNDPNAGFSGVGYIAVAISTFMTMAHVRKTASERVVIGPLLVPLAFGRNRSPSAPQWTTSESASGWYSWTSAISSNGNRRFDNYIGFSNIIIAGEVDQSC
jgi:hypothetical protein